MNQELKNKFISILKSTKREGILNLIEYLENGDFFVAPASTKYHNSFEGGLLKHSLDVYLNLSYLYKSYSRKYPTLPKIENDSLKIVGLLHDICKADTYVEGFMWGKNDKNEWIKIPEYKKDAILQMGHGAKSIFILQNFIGLSVYEATAIYWHMGAYDISAYSTVNELGFNYTDNLLAFLLNHADMFTTYITENENYFKEE